ncbi:MAG: hypothetical protein ACOZB3_09370 [Calditrichota bacterium]
MIRFLITVLSACTLAGIGFSRAIADPTDIPELSSILSLFTAQATSQEGVRINWTLDRQSPTITKFRIYRGYEEVGNFAVLVEISSHSAANDVDYSYKDTTALRGVSYYYKLAAVGQSSESVFPVVITATPLPSGVAHDMQNMAPASILPGNRIALYVREPGRIRLDVVSPPSKALVDDELRPGIYEFDPPATGQGEVTLRIRHDTDFSEDIQWPIH